MDCQTSQLCLSDRTARRDNFPPANDVGGTRETVTGKMLRRLELGDMVRAAAVHRASFDDALPTLTGLHTAEEDRAYFSERVFAQCELWGHFDKQEMTGIIAFRDGWIDQLYVLPSCQGRGIGTALLEIARSRFRNLQLWTFQRNTNARQFYERKGFTLIEVTEGSGNEEKEPDALYRWHAGD
jgi:putative acetyltransferase